MKSQTPEKVAHRGLTGLAKEKGNTLSAIHHALESNKVDAIELDIQITKDGHLVVFHDPILNLKTNGRGLVKNHTYEELQKFKIKGTDEGIPSLKEVLQLCTEFQRNTQVRKPLILDYGNPKITEKLIPLIEEYNLQRQVEYTSIHHRMLKQLKSQLPQSQIVPSFFVPHTNHIIRKAQKLGANTVHLYFPNLFFNPRMSSKLQKAKIHVRAFTVNHPYTAHLLMQRGISIISNRPTDHPKRNQIKKWHRMMLRLQKKNENEAVDKKKVNSLFCRIKMKNIPKEGFLCSEQMHQENFNTKRSI